MSKGSLRLLTSDEIALAKSIFRNLVIYSRVWIHHGSYLPFNLQGKNTAMSPNGEIYFKDWYCDDFSGKSFQYQHIFIHEMAHVWQFQCGKWVRTRGLASGFISYEYRLEKSKQLLSYRLEQQAQIIADFFLLDKFGVDIWLNNRGIDKIVSYIGPIKPNIYEDYKHVLRDFLTL